MELKGCHSLHSDGVFEEAPGKRPLTWLLCAFLWERGTTKGGSLTPCWRRTMAEAHPCTALGLENNDTGLIGDTDRMKTAYGKHKP